MRTVEDCSRVLLAGAEKVNVNSAAVHNPGFDNRGIQSFRCPGSRPFHGCAQGRSSLPTLPSGYEIVINGGRTPMGLDAIQWARRGEELGAGELVVNSIDADGTKAGYEIRLTRMIAEAVHIPVIASGGGGKLEHIYEVLTDGRADAALVASMLHYGEFTVREIKEYLNGKSH